MRTPKALTAVAITGAIVLGGLWILSLFYSCFWDVVPIPTKGGQKLILFVQSVSGYLYAGTFSVPAQMKITLGLEVGPRTEEHPPGLGRQLERYGFGGALLRLGGDANCSAGIIFYYGLPFTIDVLGLITIILLGRRNLKYHVNPV